MNVDISSLGDNAIITHFEDFHADALAMRWQRDNRLRRLSSRAVWIAYHDYFLHRPPRETAHQHNSYLWTGWEKNMASSVGLKWVQKSPCNCLHPPTHQPDCTGRQGLVVLNAETANSAQDELWRKLIYAIGLLKGPQKNDEGTAGFARGLATALAYIQNPMSPDVDSIRKRAMEMWREQNAE